MPGKEILALDTTVSGNSSISSSRYVSLPVEPGRYYIQLDTKYYYYSSHYWYSTNDSSGQYRLKVNAPFWQELDVILNQKGAFVILLQKF